ncbi:MAG: rod shape-determining protein RodA [Bacteroidia bacterium]|nr:MAG: rod shape-determining protein RodA [Bacteroidia bacterium]
MRLSAPDWTLYVLAGLLTAIGLANLYSIENFPSPSWSNPFFRQLAWTGIAIAVASVSPLIAGQTWRHLAYLLYGLGAAAMLITAFVAREVNGARAWLDIGPFRFQPAEFMKVLTALALAAFLDRYDFDWRRFSDRVGVAGLIGLPVALTLLQKDTGTALTYGALFLPLYRWGLSGWVVGIPLLLGGLAFLTLLWPWTYLAAAITVAGLLSYGLVFRRKYLGLHLIGMAFLWSWLALSSILYQKVLAPHQRQRIEVLLNPQRDPLGAGWNALQARIAITAGGLTGQGYGKGLQSKLNFIPKKHTDFAFCGLAEEWGWLGVVGYLLGYGVFLWRLIHIAEKTQSPVGLLFGYGLAGFLAIHLIINTAMVMGLFPIVGIPLVFLSYGGSSWVAAAWGIGILQSFYRERRLRLFS